MSFLEVLSLVVILLIAVAWYLTYTAARLDRLHTRVESTYAALDAQLVRRAEAVLELANSGALDPAGALIVAGAATDSLEAGDAAQVEREAIESELTHALRLVTAAGQAGTQSATREQNVDDSVRTEALTRLDDAHQRVTMARRFHNDAITDVLRLRRNLLVRVFRLAGYTDLPRTVEFDDDLPLRR
ncbi:MAG: hypothetical protein ABI746_00440 [Dermatophilaceae bacterium]